MPNRPRSLASLCRLVVLCSAACSASSSLDRSSESSADDAVTVSSQALTSTAVGRTKGSWNVTDTGAATYMIPIFTPAGTAGLTPDLAFVYSSSGGNGALGVGWSVAGLSAIERCPATAASNGSARDVRGDAVDRFCLDGDQLKYFAGAAYGQSGAEYRTEVDELARIRSYGSAGNGPAYFVVEQKSGLIYEYGNTVDSRIEWIASPNVRTWALNQIRDRAGNAISFVYGEDGTHGGYRIESVQYSSNPARGIAPVYQVAFVYEPLPAGETDSTFMGNGLIKRMSRIDRVDVTYSGSLVRRYELTFEPNLSSTGRSRLQSVQECAGPSLDCFPPTTFAYQNGTSAYEPETLAGVDPVDGLIRAMDVEGDGRTDLIFAPCDFDAPVQQANFFQASAAPAGTYPFVFNTGIPFDCTNFIPLDYNADGRDDIMFPAPDSGSWTVMLGSAQGLSRNGLINAFVPLANPYSTTAADISGDGLDDFVWYQGGYLLYKPRDLQGSFGFPVTRLTAFIGEDVSVSIETGRTALNRKADFNGDGRADLLLQLFRGDGFRQVRVVLGGILGGVPPSEFELPGALAARFADLNGDGLSDVVYSTAGGLKYRFSRGLTIGPELSAPANADLRTLVVQDWDGDGFQDLLFGNGLSVSVMRSSGEALLPPVFLFSAHYAQLFGGDFTGDGLGDLYKVLYSPGVSIFKHAGAVPDLLVSATDGFGVGATFTYASTANYARYQRGSSASYPAQDLGGPLYVVSNVRASDGIGGAYELRDFSYQGARVDVAGRGFLGFASRSWLDSRTGVTESREYRQDFPLVGAVKSEKSSKAASATSNTVFKEVQTIFQTVSFADRGPTELRYMTNPVSITQSDRELGGAYDGRLVRTTQTTNLLDWNTGTVYDSSTTVTEAPSANGAGPGQSFTTRRLLPLANLFNDIPNWCIGRPGRSEQTASHTKPGGAAQTRSVDLAWDGAGCRLTQTVLDPGHPSLQVTTRFTYDGFGNPATHSVTPIHEDARVTQYDWGADGRFPRVVTNALGQATQLDWFPELGLPRSSTDPNGLVTSGNYDGFGRELTRRNPDGTSYLTEYLPCDSDCSGVANARFKVRTTERDTNQGAISQGFSVLDAFERPRRKSSYALDGALIHELFEYDAAGRLARNSAPYLALAASPVWTTFSYDAIGRPIRAVRDRTSDQDPAAAISTIQYDGLSITSTDPQAKVRVDVMTPLAQVARVTQALGTPDQTQASYDYDAFGNLVRSTDAHGNQVQIGYDLRGFKTSVSDPDLGTWTYDNYALGDLKSQTDAKAQVTSFTYDKLSRPLTRVEPADSGTGTQTTTWTWGNSAASHDVGQLQSIALGGYSETYGYDDRARRVSTTVVADGVTYVQRQSYSATTGVLETLTYPASTGSSPFRLKYEYDLANKSGLLRQIKDLDAGTVFWQVLRSNALEQYQDVNLGNGLKTLTTFDSVTGFPNRIETGPGGGSARQSLQYAWDKVGNLTSRQDLNIAKTETFGYDNLYRLTQAQVSGGPSLALSYDPIGNITSKSDVGAYSYHPTKKHAVTTAGAITTTYDANGNAETQSAGGDTATVAWTSYNLPKLISTTSGRSSSFAYGPKRERIKQVAVISGVSETTTYVGTLLEKVTRGSATEYRHLISGPDGIIAVHDRKSSGTNETSYLLEDHLGSTDVIADAAGASRVKLSYTAFGARRKGSTWSGSPSTLDQLALAGTTRRGFTGHEHLDHLDLVHMNGRVYQPKLGRFISADPFVQDPFDTQSLNRYSYVFNNPLSNTDPTGFFTRCFGSCPDGYLSPSIFGSIFGSILRFPRIRPIIIIPRFFPIPPLPLPTPAPAPAPGPAPTPPGPTMGPNAPPPPTDVAGQVTRSQGEAWMRGRTADNAGRLSRLGRLVRPLPVISTATLVSVVVGGILVFVPSNTADDDEIIPDAEPDDVVFSKKNKNKNQPPVPPAQSHNVNQANPPAGEPGGDDDKEDPEKTARDEARRRGAELVKKFKQEGAGTGAGRSGGHGTPHIRAGAALKRLANDVPTSNPLREALKKEGERLIVKGKSINHY